MAETQTLNFGPEWLRALSGGVGSSSVASPPLSPALPKYKLADYRYGREEMLALYVKDNVIPVDLHDKEFLPILQEDPLPPLALVPFTEEEQRNFSMSVNSAAVLRLTGRGGGTLAGAPRGRSSSRGRGRGRGDVGFYQRSFDDVEGGFGRGLREMHRSQSWEERGDRRFEKPGRKDPDGAPAQFPLNHIRANYEDAGAGNARKHEFIRSESDNWRVSREEQNGEDDDVGWRLAGSRRDNERWCPPSPDGQRSAGWREHPEQRRRFPFDAREEEHAGYRRPRSGTGSVEEERDSLPEWCLEDAEEETGTFDSSGAFLSLKVRMLEKAPKEPILEEAELDFRPLEENGEYTEKDDSELEQTKDTDIDARHNEGSVSEEASPVAIPLTKVVTPPKPATPAPLPIVQPEQAEESERPLERTVVPELRPEPSKAPLHTTLPNSLVEAFSIPHVTNALPDLPVPTPSVLPAQSVPTQTQQLKPLEMPVPVAPLLPHSTGIVGPIGRPSSLPTDLDEDEGLKHFEQEAEKMVAYLQDGGVDDERLAAKIGPKPTALPITHEAAFKWFYKDPQGEIQGPFSNQEMSEWFQAGYFTMTLQVKRGCDEMFQPLGEIMKIWGRVPFTPGPTLPPMLGDAEQERLKRQQEINALNMYQLQQMQYQYLLRQQYAQALAQQKVLSSAPPPPQHQQLNLLLHQALKIRTPEPQQSLLPPVTRSMSVPDSGSVWEMQNPSTQASCSTNMQPAAPSTWEGSSVWDLPLDSMTQASSIEQMQLEKAKSLKLEMERREAELRAKREEEERKRLEEALRARQEEERKRLEEEELARRKQEEALQRQREQEEAQRRQKKEEEERLAQEEALRRLEEKREEEERRQREEFLRKQQEEERRKQEELEALRRREEEKRQEEEAAAALAKQQQEEQKKREQEAQKQQELQRQRQQQQEALRRLQQQQQQQQLAQMKLPSSSKWGQQAATANSLSQSQNALSLSEIQKLEEERERQAREEQRRLQQELQRVQQQQQPQAKLSGWGNVPKQTAATKSLLEIQREEAQQMKQRKEQQTPQQQPLQQQQQQQQQHTTITQQNRTQNRTTINASVWGSVSNAGSHWVMDSSVWGDAQNSNIGFWDEAVEAAPPPSTRKSHNLKNKGNANLSNSSGGKASKKVEEEEKLLKLFQGANKNQDGFMQWCEQTLHTLNTANNLDVPTFALFLKEVDSPYEVHDYVRAYLGDTPQAKDFAKQFLERRAKQNANQQKPQQVQQQKQQDSMWGMSQVSQSVLQQQQQQQQQRFETVTSGKKKKKQKMVRADPSLLVFLQETHLSPQEAEKFGKIWGAHVFLGVGLSKSRGLITLVFLSTPHLRDSIWARSRRWKTFEAC
ncbi:GRB10-interacting GYF protein 2-like isoform X4 [Myxocyprinus asiaticus]|uniref:GRB10-interacting GYF protein 2-like isoform X4 n=1 Tax=Myxocyprinus asiaticus TaxID=70543 RepID=UPI002223E863|nr:GRB10-interacting GYF protein 2-like isoform X4 [Myxocyprinus asiaticus]